MKLLDKEVTFTKITEKQRSKLYRLWQAEMFKLDKIDEDLPEIKDLDDSAKLKKGMESAMRTATLVSVTDSYDKMIDLIFPCVLVNGMRYDQNFETIMADAEPSLETVIFAVGIAQYLGNRSTTKSNQSAG